MKKKYILFIVAALLIAVIPVYNYFTAEEEAESIVVEVKKGPLEITVKSTGELQAERSQDIQGPSLRNIGVWRIKITDLVPEGTVLQKGDYVAQLDKNEIDQKLEEVREQVQKVETQYEQTQLDTALELRSLRDQLINLKYSVEEAEIEAEESVFESPATKRQAAIKLDKAERALEQANENYALKVEKNKASMMEVHINLTQQKRRLSSIQEAMDELTIFAPEPGMVIYHKEWNGQKRKVGSEIDSWNPTVATLPDMSSMISKTYINEIDISKISKGQQVIVEIDAFPGKQYEGIVTEVANVGEDLSNSDAKVFEVLIKLLGNDSILRPSMTTSNLIKIDNKENVLQIPLEAIRNNDSLTYVIKENGYSPVKQIIEPGVANDHFIEVVQGLAEKDIVYLSNPENLNELPYEGLEIYQTILDKREKQKQEELERMEAEKNKRDSLGQNMPAGPPPGGNFKMRSGGPIIRIIH
ncbi:MAG: HlyD family efflux transporter periplasmic adaptor subunit [Bacteroidales bacterium]|nr:HlyD family efflux transporter periplasmic adaptor subunit [Bacteroidales bacterium]